MMSQPETLPVVGGVYQHYKGDDYTVIGFAFHHDTREELVLYRSHEKGWVNARPLRGTAADPDGWLTPVRDEGGNERPRFVLVPETTRGPHY
jgi:hypothetical protein